MLYRELEKTGLRVSQLGFGAMRLPMIGEGKQAYVDLDKAVPMMHRAFELGVNYIDTAVMYCNDDGQHAVGAALKGWRDRIILSTKNHYYGDDESVWWRNLENSLERLDVEYIDIYNTHGVNWKSYQEQVEPYIGKWLQKAKDQGLIRHICTSFHDDNTALEKIIDTGRYDVVTVQYNLLDRQLEAGIVKAREAGMGVVVMGPVGGGRLDAPSEALAESGSQHSIPELALRFVLSNPDVTVTLSGMSSLAQVEENVRIAADEISLSNEEKQAIDAHLARLEKMVELYCTGCRYCMPCPQGVNIPEIFRRYNEARVYGLWDSAKRMYGERLKNDTEGQRSAEHCIVCGECEPKCPQSIAIAEELKAAHDALS